MGALRGHGRSVLAAAVVGVVVASLFAWGLAPSSFFNWSDVDDQARQQGRIALGLVGFWFGTWAFAFVNIVIPIPAFGLRTRRWAMVAWLVTWALFIPLAVGGALLAESAGLETEDAAELPPAESTGDPDPTAPEDPQPATVEECVEQLVGLCPPLAADVRAWYQAHEAGWNAVADDVQAHLALISRADRDGPGVLEGHCDDLLPAAETVRSWAAFPEADGRRMLSEAARLMEFIAHTCSVDIDLGVTGNAAGTGRALFDYLRFTEAAISVAYGVSGEEPPVERYTSG